MKAAVVNTMFAQMLEKCNNLPQDQAQTKAKIEQKQQHNFRATSQSKPVTGSKSEVGYAGRETDRLTLQSDEDETNSNNAMMFNTQRAADGPTIGNDDDDDYMQTG